MAEGVPAYLELGEKGLREVSERLLESLHECRICPHECGEDRFRGRGGKCRTGRDALVSSFGPHFGEESPLVGRSGSGTIFFAWCNLRCSFCQNYTISQEGEGRETDPSGIASMMFSLQERGCHNINLVSPTHVVPQFVEALVIAAAKGLKLPVVYNSGGYDSVSTLSLLKGIVDVYMPDFKYGNEEVGEEFSGIPGYTEIAKRAIKEMHSQVGDLVLGSDGVAARGLLIRHLVLPGGIAGTEEVMKFLAGEISRDTYVNIMDQYRPCYRAYLHPGISRRVTPEEMEDAFRIARREGLHRFDHPSPRLLFWI